MDIALYSLCAVTSLSCTVLLLGHYRRTRVTLLFWSALAFLAFTLTNILLFLDLGMIPEVDMSILRNSITLLGVVVLLYGLIHDHT